MVIPVVAEIGNSHFGDIERFKDLIYACKSAGATLVKSQLFLGGEFKGSMPDSFYKKCSIKPSTAIDLIYFAKALGVDLFYSIFNEKEYEPVISHMKYRKFAASQYSLELDPYDSESTFISFQPMGLKLFKDYPKSHMLLAGKYCDPNPPIQLINAYRQHMNRPFGWSDHTEGIETALIAVKEFKASCIEKHVVLKEDKKRTFDGWSYRDNIHAATPDDLKTLIKEIQ